MWVEKNAEKHDVGGSARKHKALSLLGRRLHKPKSILELLSGLVCFIMIAMHFSNSAQTDEAQTKMAQPTVAQPTVAQPFVAHPAVAPAVTHPSQAADRGVRIAVVIPCFRVKAHIGDVIAAIGEDVGAIYVIDDACPEHSGAWVKANLGDARIRVIEHPTNQGVGGAVISGYRAALADGFEIVVKIDGDGQMHPVDLPRLVRPILLGQADYCKGNRFFHPEDLAQMPLVRLLGNGGLSLLSKLSSGYWQIFDPTNGYTAIHGAVLANLPLHKISKRYFFESDMLFRLGLMRAMVIDVPMKARYGNEISQLRAWKVAPEFAAKHLRNFIKRIVYQYYLRDMSIASLELPLGLLLSAFGLIFGSMQWMRSVTAETTASAGTVMLAALPLMLGIQFLLNALAFDMAAQPREALHPLLERSGQTTSHE